MAVKKRACFVYIFCFILILAAEVLIALFVNDSFIRPYVGDILVSILICCFLRALVLYRVPRLPLWVFLFSLTVEIGQSINFVELLGLDKYLFFSIILGSTFSWLDIICYAVGCILFYITEMIALKKAS